MRLIDLKNNIFNLASRFEITKIPSQSRDLLAGIKENATRKDSTALIALENAKNHKEKSLEFWQEIHRTYMIQCTYFKLTRIRVINNLRKKYNQLLDYIAIHDPQWIQYPPQTLRELLITMISNPMLRDNYNFTIERINICIYIAEAHYNKLKETEPQRLRAKLKAKLEQETPANGYGMTINQVREIHRLCQKNNNETVNYCNARNILNSIWENQLSFDEYESNEYFEHNGEYYSSENYCITVEEEIAERDNCSWCEYSEEYTNDPVVVYISYSQTETWARTAAEEYAYEYNGDYYAEEALSEHGLRLDDYGDVRDADLYLREYHHDTNTSFKLFSDNEFRIGFEIEKEDWQILESIEIDSFEYETDHLWRKEEDGSLNNNGFELVSPCFSLDPQDIAAYIENNDILLDHVNADYSDNCGGHINLSRKDLTGEEFFNQIKGYLPLIYALNQDRINEHYCTAKKSEDLVKDKRKYQSIAIWDNRIEFRIFSAVQNFDQLMWRCELMDLLTQNLTNCPKVAYFNTVTALEKHLKEGFDNEYFYIDNYSDYDEFLDTIKTYTLDYEGLEIE